MSILLFATVMRVGVLPDAAWLWVPAEPWLWPPCATWFAEAPVAFTLNTMPRER
ncbi:Uncharacterised protein [Mycobacterium tuberculosis]|nr:Uncharacterised protein [Mycobacterium tuberculosis]